MQVSLLCTCCSHIKAILRVLWERKQFFMQYYRLFRICQLENLKVTLSGQFKTLCLPIAGSRTACAACSSPIGVLRQIFLSFIATGESSDWATVTQNTFEYFVIIHWNFWKELFTSLYYVHDPKALATPEWQPRRHPLLSQQPDTLAFYFI